MTSKQSLSPRLDKHGRCAATNEQPYPDNLTALTANTETPLVKVYLCPHCDRWHVMRSGQ